MKKQDTPRGPNGKRNEKAVPSNTPTPAQPPAPREVTEQELEQVQGGASMVELPITSVAYEGPDSFQILPQWRPSK